ncbi:MAG: hypothetical protein NTW02_14470 [Cyanobium sp. LacPavin_0920_WC12_MAG_62_9]|nr:hypothetical protein [Cyanobium sp. LacPavin_0920_WC12_MAG_62_9]
MANAPYLVALALVELDGKRALPLTGKTQSAASIDPANNPANDPGDDGRTLALELLLRLWQRSDEGPLQRAAADNSLLLIEIPLDVMSEQLPLLKASWLASGDTAAFETSLKALVIRGWRMGIAKYEPVSFSPWP